jgi:hypothetical protein
MLRPLDPGVIGQFLIGLRLMTSGNVVVVIVILVIVVGQLRFVGGLLGIERRSHVVGSRPSQFFARRVTTAVAPALLGVGTATGMMLARKWLACDLAHTSWRRITD